MTASMDIAILKAAMKVSNTECSGDLVDYCRENGTTPVALAASEGLS